MCQSSFHLRPCLRGLLFIGHRWALFLEDDNGLPAFALYQSGGGTRPASFLLLEPTPEPTPLSFLLRKTGGILCFDIGGCEILGRDGRCCMLRRYVVVRSGWRGAHKNVGIKRGHINRFTETERSRGFSGIENQVNLTKTEQVSD
jgi:hypothetical protein